MKRTLILALRITTQLRRDKRLLALSIMAPLVVIYLLKIFFDTLNLPPLIPKERYIIPVCAFIVHFVCYVLCTIILVQERRQGTLERLVISGLKRHEIIGGFLLGYFSLATLQTAVILLETFLLFGLRFGPATTALLFAVIWLLAIVSVLLGIFVSTFARHEGQIFPFIPLVIMPSAFLSGMIVDVSLLPGWAQAVSRVIPLYYANNVIQALINPPAAAGTVILHTGLLAGYILLLLLAASCTFRDVE